MFEFVKSIFGSKKSEEETKVEKFKKYAESKGYTYIGWFEKSGKLSFKSDVVGLVITLATNDVVTTKGSKKFKRYALSDQEVMQVINDPWIRINDKKFQIIDK